MKKKILLVEDENYSRKIVFDLMSKFYDIHTAEDGKKGLELFKSEGNFDLVITDIEMPKLDGLRMSEDIKKIDNNVPIYITSAYDDSENIQKAKDLGINRFIKKPVKITELFEFIKRDF